MKKLVVSLFLRENVLSIRQIHSSKYILLDTTRSQSIYRYMKGGNTAEDFNFRGVFG